MYCNFVLILRYSQLCNAWQHLFNITITAIPKTRFHIKRNICYQNIHLCFQQQRKFRSLNDSVRYPFSSFLSLRQNWSLVNLIRLENASSRCCVKLAVFSGKHLRGISNSLKSFDILTAAENTRYHTVTPDYFSTGSIGLSIPMDWD
jgi:hypothetical protein